jgi:hypothetical protein
LYVPQGEKPCNISTKGWKEAGWSHPCLKCDSNLSLESLASHSTLLDLVSDLQKFAPESYFSTRFISKEVIKGFE